MSFSRCLLSSALLGGLVFTALTLPLSAVGSKPVVIQLEEKPVFVGEVKDLAAPYLGLATVISLGACVASLTMAGWRKSSRKLSETEGQMSTLKQQLQERDALIESLKFSDSKLESSGLHFFLEEEEVALPPAPPAAVTPKPVERYTVVEASQPAHRYADVHTVMSTDGEVVAVDPNQQAMMSRKSQVQATTALAAAQAFMGYARPVMPENSFEPATSQSARTEPEESPQIDELLNNLKQMMAHIEKLHVVQPAPQIHKNYSANTWQQIAS